jgi:hypothetical protein
MKVVLFYFSIIFTKYMELGGAKALLLKFLLNCFEVV